MEKDTTRYGAAVILYLKPQERATAVVLAPISSGPGTQLEVNMKSFDKATGTVYTETVSAAVGSMVPTWMFQARGRRDKKSTLKGRGKGCSRLQDMALRSCAWHSDLFEPDTLQLAGWYYAHLIYQHLLDTYVAFQKHSKTIG